MLQLFTSNRAVVVFLLPFLIGAYQLCHLFFGVQAMDESTLNLGYWGSLDMPFQLRLFLGFGFIFLNAYLINHSFNKHAFFDRNMYVPSLMYVVLMSFYQSFYYFDGLLLAHTFLILCLTQLFHLRQNEDGRSHVFNGALFAGVAASLHPPLTIILPFLFLMIWSIRPFVMRESLLLISGFGIPLVYSGFYLTWFGESIELRLLKFAAHYTGEQINFIVTAVLFVLLLVIGVLGIRQKIQKSSIRFKKLVSILWTYLFLGILLGAGDYVFFGQIERFSFILIPLPFFLAYSFTTKGFKITAELLFYITLAYSFVKFFI